MNKIKITAAVLAAITAFSSVTALAGCRQDQSSVETTAATADSAEKPAAAKDTTSKPEATTEFTTQKSSADGDYFSHQEVRDSPAWVTELDAAKDAEQMIVVAGVGKSTAFITMHEKDKDGKWQQIISTPGFIGESGLGEGVINHSITPVGTFTVRKAFGLADDPGCQMEYTKVDDTYYWSGDSNHEFNKLVTTKDVPDLDTVDSEHIVDFDYAYQYVLDMGYNSECDPKKGYAFFFHCFRVNRPYTGGCVAVPESIMKFIMQHIKPGCKFTIDSLENFGGDIDA